MSYNEILNSDISKSKNVIYKFTNLINQKIYEDIKKNQQN